MQALVQHVFSSDSPKAIDTLALLATPTLLVSTPDEGDLFEPRQMLLRATGTRFNSKWSFTRSQDLDPKQVTYPP